MDTSSRPSQQSGPYNPRVLRIVKWMLLFSLLLQVASLAAPGWLVYDSSYKAGLFYAVSCENGSCESISFWKQYVDYMTVSKDSSEKSHTRRSFSIGTARLTTGALLSVTFTLSSIWAMACIQYNSTQSHLRMLYVLSAILLVTGFIMGEILYVYFVELDFLNHVLDEPVGFPYCVLFYVLACLLVFGSVCGMFKSFADLVADTRQGAREHWPNGGGVNLALRL